MGWVIPVILCLIFIFFLTDKRVKEEILNPSYMGRSRWSAIRKGIICGVVIKYLVVLPILTAGLLGLLSWVGETL